MECEREMIGTTYFARKGAAISFLVILISSSISGCLNQEQSMSDNTIDTDGDGVIDDLDACPGFSDYVDYDGDNITDLIIVDPVLCADFIDSDGDKVVDSLDLCIGSDDSVDKDGDGIPDGCDELIDTDKDGISDDSDICPESNDVIDVEGDGVADLQIIDIRYCGFIFDSDSDGIPNLIDKCEGFDDNIDLDSDGTPDQCDEEVPHPQTTCYHCGRRSKIRPRGRDRPGCLRG